jgi:hypothetical protein
MRRNLFNMRKSNIGFHLPVPLAEEIWCIALRKAARTASTSRWHLADLLLHAEGKRYGKTHQAAIAETGLAPQTIANLKSVARGIEISRRRENLSFGHHAEVAALPKHQQDQLLELAVKNHWTRNDLREQVQKSDLADDEPFRPRSTDKSPPTDPPTPHFVRVRSENGLPYMKAKEVDPVWIREVHAKFQPNRRIMEEEVGSEPEKPTLDAADRELRTFLLPWLEKYSATIGTLAADHFRQGLRLIEQMTGAEAQAAEGTPH